MIRRPGRFLPLFPLLIGALCAAILIWSAR